MPLTPVCVHRCRGGLYQSSSLTPSASDAASQASAHTQQLTRQRSGQHATADGLRQNVSGQQAARAGLLGGALPAVPEDAVLGGVPSDQAPQAKEPKKVVKKKRKKKMKRKSRLSQLGGMGDVERSRWMLGLFTSR